VLLGFTLCILFDNLYFFIGQAVEGIDELVDLFVGGVDLSLDFAFFCGDFGGRQSLTQVLRTESTKIPKDKWVCNNIPLSYLDLLD